LKERCFFASNFTNNCNRWALYLVTGVFLLTSVIYMTVSVVKMSAWHPFVLGQKGSSLLIL
jgi:hypothetical protein